MSKRKNGPHRRQQFETTSQQIFPGIHVAAGGLILPKKMGAKWRIANQWTVVETEDTIEPTTKYTFLFTTWERIDPKTGKPWGMEGVTSVE